MERDAQINTASNKSAIEEFKLAIESFKDRVSQAEMESNNSKTTASFLQDQFDIFKEQSAEFRKTQVAELNDIRSKVIKGLSSLDKNTFTLKQHLAMSDAQVKSCTEVTHNFTEKLNILNLRFEKHEVDIDRLK